MNKLRNTRTYLCGAMGLADDNGVAWRQRVGAQLKGLGVIVLDPCDKPIDIGLESMEDRDRRARMKAAGDYEQVAGEMKIIRCVDLRMVDISDFLIVNIDLDIYTVGTWEEVTTANRQKKPIIVHVEQGKENTPDWLLAMIPHQMIYSSWEAVINYLRGVNSGVNISHFKRWYFFNLEKPEPKNHRFLATATVSQLIEELQLRRDGIDCRGSDPHLLRGSTDAQILETLKSRFDVPSEDDFGRVR